MTDKKAKAGTLASGTLAKAGPLASQSRDARQIGFNTCTKGVGMGRQPGATSLGNSTRPRSRTSAPFSWKMLRWRATSQKQGLQAQYTTVLGNLAAQNEAIILPTFRHERHGTGARFPNEPHGRNHLEKTLCRHSLFAPPKSQPPNRRCFFPNAGCLRHFFRVRDRNQKNLYLRTVSSRASRGVLLGPSCTRTHRHPPSNTSGGPQQTYAAPSSAGSAPSAATSVYVPSTIGVVRTTGTRRT